MANALDEMSGPTNPKGNAEQISKKPGLYKKATQTFFSSPTPSRTSNFKVGSEEHKKNG